MRLPSYAVKGAVLLSLLTTPAYANQDYVNMIRTMSVKQIAEWNLEYNHELIVRHCRAGKRINAKGLSWFDTDILREYYMSTSKKSGIPYDVIKKSNEGVYYAMYSVCPDVY